MTASTSSASANTSNHLIGSAQRTLSLEAHGITALANALGDGLAEPFTAAVERITAASGRVIVTGIGKSGHVGRKIASTLASTGTPASFVHPSEASHGDLGMIAAGDVLLALSWSGESAELKDLIDYSRRFKVPLIAFTSKAESALGRAADIILMLPTVKEACPHGLAPTTSTTMQLALGDALALSLLEARGFTAADFKTFHPGGKLGARLTLVRDIMHAGRSVPLARTDTGMSEALIVMTEKSLGCIGIIDDEGHLVGVITDGDLRRNMRPDLPSLTAEAIMTRGPKAVPPTMLASQALEIVNASSITSLFVVENDKPVGVVHMHDLLRAGIA